MACGSGGAEILVVNFVCICRRRGGGGGIFHIFK